jgi:hypothetical protein
MREATNPVTEAIPSPVSALCVVIIVAATSVFAICAWAFRMLIVGFALLEAVERIWENAPPTTRAS